MGDRFGAAEEHAVDTAGDNLSGINVLNPVEGIQEPYSNAKAKSGIGCLLSLWKARV